MQRNATEQVLTAAPSAATRHRSPVHWARCTSKPGFGRNSSSPPTIHRTLPHYLKPLPGDSGGVWRLLEQGASMRELDLVTTPDPGSAEASNPGGSLCPSTCGWEASARREQAAHWKGKHCSADSTFPQHPDPAFLGLS